MAPSEADERGAKVSFPPPAVFLGALLIGVAIGQWVRSAPIGLPRALSIGVGIVIVGAAIALIASAWTLFTRTGQDPKPWAPTPELIFSGPYRFTRNPMYVSMTLLQIGLGFVLNNLWVVALALPALLVVHVIAVVPEEAYLSEKFGDGYRAYLTRVRRYL